MASPVLQYQSLSGVADLSFWHELAEKKLNEFKLNNAPCEISGTYTVSTHVNVGARMNLRREAFSANQHSQADIAMVGTLHNANTIEQFQGFNRQELLHHVSSQMWTDILSGAALHAPGLLNRFILLTFLDLKKYVHSYCFAFPALDMPKADQVKVTQVSPILNRFSREQLSEVSAAFSSLPNETRSFFWVVREGDRCVRLEPLKNYHDIISTNHTEDTEVMLAFLDPCPLPSNPGWPLRNGLALVTAKLGIRGKLSVVCFRDVFIHRNIERDPKSIVIDVLLAEAVVVPDTCPATVGWEKQPRSIDLRKSMDPVTIAESAVDLNLKLMRWRLLPELDTERVAKTRCLLLGAGTLGCTVARCLLGWGVRNVTLCDNGRVAFSNPVRQSLFEFTDCLEGGRLKATCAAEHLTKIFPGVNAVGHELSIPMPGHVVDSAEEIQKAEAEVARLSGLIQEHDIVFLLTDTRESRWLPTLLCCVQKKLALTVALGFDSFVVMRHGVPADPATDNDSRLGCYFCNDITAPADSMKDRTLDQQCTVTRPGLSFISGAVAVELMVGLLHHPLGVRAPGQNTAQDAAVSPSPLGVLPHQIRGGLGSFTNTLITGHAFNKCTACSDTVINKYKEDGFGLCLQAFNSPTYLEDLTGITALKRQVDDAVQFEEEFDDDDDALL
eukprot:GILK01005667.1.p1 GENE.GILK01005667.1~~GILK01005667.1.p1  ORF type:complete len:681 (+),score=116.50 GILK01005667.1:36-2045(+)